MFSFEKLEEKYREIPDDVREAISSSAMNEKLLQLTNKYRLQFDEAEELTKEIGFVMLGLKPTKNFVKNIQNVSGLSYEKSKQMAEDINNEIFGEIRESLQKIHQEAEEQEDDLDEEQIRNELLREIEKPAVKTTEIIKAPETKLVVTEEKKEISNPKQLVATENLTEQNQVKPTEKLAEQTQSPQPTEQNLPKKYIIDPYREQLD
ncbi:MAG: hypothetical protein ABIG87_00425 [Patescibacteria group bacterium]